MWFAAVLLAGLVSTTPADEWNQVFEVGNAPELHIKTSDADIIVESGPVGQIDARVATFKSTFDKLGLRIEPRQEGDTVYLTVKYPRNVQSRTIGRVQIYVRVPEDVRLELRTGDGEIEVAGIRGEVTVTSGDGDIKIEDGGGTLRARAGDGDLRLAGRFDLLQVETGDGDVEVRALQGSAVITRIVELSCCPAYSQ